jgi:geranylgeranyl pyrophosphate synthase
MLVNPYESYITNLIEEHINAYFEPKDPIKPVIRYAMSNGKKWRPAISLDIYISLMNKTSPGKCILAIEYIHAASLIVDDLPCMDNAITRRGKDCVHTKFGQAAAQLTSATLLAMSVDALSRDLDESEDNYELLSFFTKTFSRTMREISGGQLLDLATDDPYIRHLVNNVNVVHSVTDIIQKKTGALFETSFLIGWLFGKGDFEKVEVIKDISHDFSLAFQITDDLDDIEEDMKTNRKDVNYAIVFGRENAIEKCIELLEAFEKKMTRLNLYSEFFANIVTYMKNKVSE